MSIVNVISAIGNNSSIYPLLIRDCGIENVAKVVMTYNQNVKESKVIAKHATRERIVDEYVSSSIWLGGIPLMEKISNFCIKKSGFEPSVDLKLFEENSQQGIDYNIKKFKDIAGVAVEDLIKIKNNKKQYQKLVATKFLASTIIPIVAMGFVLPKLNFNYTKNKRKQELAEMEKSQSDTNTNTMLKDTKTFADIKKQKELSFKGLEALSGFNSVQKMQILDGGLTIGRVKNARNTPEKLEMAFKMAGMCYLNYCAPAKIEKLFNFISKKMFNLDVDLDPKILADKSVISKLSNLNIPKENLIDYIDNNPKSVFTNCAEKIGLINRLPNGVRDPRKFVDIKKLENLKNNLDKFSKSADSPQMIEKIAKQAFRAKTFNILANISVSSVLLALVLPKAQFLFRKLITGSDLEPGIK